MGKKQALGSIPTFENVAKATLTNDLFTEEEIKEAQEETKKQLEEEKLQEQKKEEVKAEPKKENKIDDIEKRIIERAKKQALKENISLEEKLQRETSKRKQELEARSKEIIKDIEERTKGEDKLIEQVVKGFIAPNKEDATRTQRGTKPSNKQRLANGYIRATFEVNEEQLELIKAIGLFKDMKQKDIIEALIERGLADISEAVKEEALKQYRNNNEPKENKKAKDLFN